MNEHKFCCISTKRIAALIARARRRVVLCAPAVRRETAEACVAAAARIGAREVRVVVDCDEEVFRLGYGEVDAVKSLSDREIDVRQCAGLRVGVLVIDDQAWVFSPTALYVQSEVHSDETPNAITLHHEAAELLARSILPTVTEPAPAGTSIRTATPEIGNSPLASATLERVVRGLELAPPMPFDVARQVRVFQPYIQYVEINLQGCAIQRHRVTIPRTMQGLGASRDIERRLKTTFEVIEKDSELSSQPLEQALENLRRNFTRSLGKPWGRVLLRSVRPAFDQRIVEFRQQLEEHRRRVERQLEAKLEASRQEVVEYYLPAVRAHPPDSLLGQLVTPKPSERMMRDWLNRELSQVFPCAADLLSSMLLDVQFRDVTYETLNEEGFADALKEAYPHVTWDKPFGEFHAAGERSRADDSRE